MRFTLTLAVTFDKLGERTLLALDQQIARMESDIAACSSDSLLAAESERVAEFARAMRQSILNLKPIVFMGMPVTMHNIVRLGIVLFSAFFTALSRKIMDLESIL